MYRRPAPPGRPPLLTPAMPIGVGLLCGSATLADLLLEVCVPRAPLFGAAGFKGVVGALVARQHVVWQETAGDKRPPPPPSPRPFRAHGPFHGQGPTWGCVPCSACGAAGPTARQKSNPPPQTR